MKIRILDEKGIFHNISVKKDESHSLLALLIENHYYLPAPCGGNGSCGHCLIQLISGELDITEKDRSKLSQDQLKKGFRLACQAYPKESISIRLTENSVTGVPIYNNSIDTHNNNSQYIIAIDLGSTTLAYALVDQSNGNIIQTLNSTNPQTSYGSDIMNRMEASNKGFGQSLSDCIKNKIYNDLKILTINVSQEKIQKIIISGNTAMIHLFMNYSCKTLSKYPFTALTLKELHLSSKELKLFDLDIPVIVMQGFSAFVGGDIFSGIYYLQKNKKEEFYKPWLLLDLGTNAEMVLHDGKETFYISSAPAGPAFEAANISCGIAAINGAITQCNIIQNELSFETIHNDKAIGVCGSGLIELCYELLKNGLIDETGLLKDPYFEEGYPIVSEKGNNLYLKQEDIRALQMAKSAVFSALQILLEKANLQYEELQNIYMAGSFGNYLNLKKAVGISLLPIEILDRMKILGNSSLKGAIVYGLENKKCSENFKNYKIEEIILANEEGFRNHYCENMYFNKRPL